MKAPCESMNTEFDSFRTEEPWNNKKKRDRKNANERNFSCRHCKIGRLLFHRCFLSIRLGWFSLKLLSNWVQLSHTHAHAFSISCFFFYSHFPTFPHNETVELGRHVYGVLNLLLYIVYLCYSNSIVFMFIKKINQSW